MKRKTISVSLALLTLVNTAVFAEEKVTEQTKQNPEKELQDMSDPLAVYTQVGVGTTNRGLNLKIGKSYDPGKPKTMAMNVVEIKGMFGDALGWDNDKGYDNSIDLIRFRNFKVDMSNGRGGQIDFNYSFDKNHLAEQSGDISYSLMQALPKMSIFNLYPLAGLGASFGKDVTQEDGTVDSGYAFNGTFGLIGMYGKMAITDKLWLNYNPFWLTTFTGSNIYKDHAYGKGNSSLLTHEFAVNYQFTPRFNVRYFANWNQDVSYGDGDHRIEFNYQL